MGISIRAYARHRGVAHNAVCKAIKAGRIQLNKDKTLDVAQADLDWEQNTNPAKAGSAKRRSVPVDGRTHDGVAKRNSDPGVSDPGGPLRGYSGATGGTTYTQAKTTNEVLKAQLNRQRLQEKKGQLINKDMVKAQIFRLGHQFRDAVQNWPSRVSAQMAAELQLNEHLLQITLEAYLRELLNELGDSKLNID